MNSKISTVDSKEELSRRFAQLLIDSTGADNEFINIALSGGTTPKYVFEYLAKNYSTGIRWNKIRLFWGDERCVPKDHADSNYKMAFESFISEVGILKENIFRIHGEIDPKKEALNYSRIIAKNVPKYNGMLQFDIIMLGLGEDGHTASIFPGRLDLFNSIDICEAVEHPLTHQKRITLTGSVINNAKKIVFLVTGESKSGIIDQVINKKPGFDKLPASYIKPVNGELIWLLDNDAGTLLNNV